LAVDSSAAFVSYSRADSEFALRLVEDLKAAGANIWLDRLALDAGKPWDIEIQEALVACSCILVILSPASVNSANVLDEVSFALKKQKTVIPVLHLDCEIPFRLDRLQHVDFRTDHARGLKTLLKALGVGQLGAVAAVSVVQPAIQPDTSGAERQRAAEEAQLAEERRHEQAEEARLAALVVAERTRASDQAHLKREKKLLAEETQKAAQEREWQPAVDNIRLKPERKSPAWFAGFLHGFQTYDSRAGNALHQGPDPQPVWMARNWRWAPAAGIIVAVLLVAVSIHFLRNSPSSPLGGTPHPAGSSSSASNEPTGEPAVNDATKAQSSAESPLTIKADGYVTDLANVIGPNTRKELEGICAEVQQKTGAQIAVVTVRSLGGRSRDGFSNALFMHLGIGSKQDNRGVLLLVVPSERQYRIEVGYGLEPLLTNSRADEIGLAMAPDFRRGNYDAGVKLGVTRLAQSIAADSKVALQSVRSSPPTSK